MGARRDPFPKALRHRNQRLTLPLDASEAPPKCSLQRVRLAFCCWSPLRPTGASEVSSLRIHRLCVCLPAQSGPSAGAGREPLARARARLHVRRVPPHGGLEIQAHVCLGAWMGGCLGKTTPGLLPGASGDNDPPAPGPNEDSKDQRFQPQVTPYRLSPEPPLPTHPCTRLSRTGSVHGGLSTNLQGFTWMFLVHSFPPFKKRLVWFLVVKKMS